MFKKLIEKYEIVLSIILILSNVIFIISLGYFLDENNFSNSFIPFWTGDGSWILLFLSFLFFLFFVVIKNKNNLIKKIIKICFLLFILFNTYKLINNFMYIIKTNTYLENLRNITLNNGYESSNYLTISLDNLNDIIKSKKSQLIYIGRPNCPYCKNFDARLGEYLTNNNKTILYYNTIYDRENNNIEMTSTLNKLNVQTVPSIVKLDNGNVEKLITGDDIDEIFEQTKVLLEN